MSDLKPIVFTTIIIALSACAADTTEDDTANDGTQSTTGAIQQTSAVAGAPVANAHDTSDIKGFWDDSSWDGTFFERYLYITEDGRWQDFERRNKSSSANNCLDSRTGTVTLVAENTYFFVGGFGYSETIISEKPGSGFSGLLWEPTNGKDRRIIPRALFSVNDVQGCSSVI